LPRWSQPKIARCTVWPVCQSMPVRGPAKVP
jgi:hypothetical protein